MTLTQIIELIFVSIARAFRKYAPKAKTAIRFGILVAEEIKTAEEDGTANIITALIPGEVDNAVNAKIKAALPGILIRLRLVDATLGLTDPVEIVRNGVAVLRSITGDERGHFYDALAVEIAIVAADGKLTWQEAKKVMKWYHDNIYKKEVAAAA